MDRYRTGIAIFRLAPFERVIIRKAPSLLSMYLGWHILYIIGTIYRNSRFLKIIHADDDPRLQRSLYSVRAGWIFWIGILAILALFLLVRSPKAGRDVVNAILPDDERIQMNWLRACRLSFLFVLMLLLASRLISIIYYVIFHYVWNDRPPAQLMTSLFNWQYILSDLKIILLTAVVTLLGSYHHYDNKY
jgi:hypothetical protein